MFNNVEKDWLSEKMKLLPCKSVLTVGDSIEDLFVEFNTRSDIVICASLPEKKYLRPSKDNVNQYVAFFEDDSGKIDVDLFMKDVEANTGVREFDFLFLSNMDDRAFNLFSPLVRKSGIVALHGIGGLNDTKKFWQELQKDHVTTSLFNNLGIGILYV